VRFTDKEYQFVLELKKVTGKSIPQLLKDALLKKKIPLRPFCDRDVANTLLRQLRGIANNINQGTKKVNSGFRAGWYISFDVAFADLRKLTEVIARCS